ncbi:guanine-N-1-methyltransferase [Epithele typhae]|uniref:guanine-N-1-methyltransferase n=1 Tax=Epithele typhae TaxID=378194 RepID=UPI0020079BA3|nr:guanine-N-1-methyltransferase [Epithele typhae]KAH9920236.1 guanine-N-1-methyltransferase [Epithele typhae]
MPKGIGELLTLPAGAGLGLKDGALDKSAFRKVIPVLAAKTAPETAGTLLKAPALRGTLINVPKVKSVVQNPIGERLVLLRYSDRADLPPVALDFLQERAVDLVTHELTFGYDYWSTGACADDVVQAILPQELLEGAPSGFAAVGHIAHLNMRPEYLPYKYLIGQIIIDKNPKIRTVVNKLDSISAEFRVFDMELLAGDPEFMVTQMENECRFTFDFREVYWNTRLHTEHERLIDQFDRNDLVADVFAGVGPFAVPAAKKGCAVLANDLNPASFKYLTQNITDNKVDARIRAFCEDGRELRAENLPLPSAGPVRSHIDHFVMNLPDTAILFLDAFRGVLSAENRGDRNLSGVYTEERMPIVHCHCFTRERERAAAVVDIRQRAEEKLGASIGEDATFHCVRTVAPQKDMYCVSFKLPHAVAFAE